jgi:GDP-D-mannose dehydratase
LSVRTDPSKIRPLERPVLVCDPSLARTALGWAARTVFQDGIRHVLAAAPAKNLA